MPANPRVPDASEDSAFALSGPVTWDTGFGDEDLSAPPPRPAATAPRPAPAPALSDEHQAPFEPTPVPLPAPSPVPAAVTAPPPSPLRLEAADTDVPEWARIRPTAQPRPAFDDIVDPPANPPADMPAAEAPQGAPLAAAADGADDHAGGQATTRGRRRSSARQDRPGKQQRPPRPSGGNLAGGRWKVKVLRGAVFGVLGLLLLGGARNLVAPVDRVDPETLATDVAAVLGQTDFPRVAAEAYAVGFTNTYLTYSEEGREQRVNALQAYSPDAASGQYGLSPSGGAQTVITGPFVSGDIEVLDGSNAVVPVAAQVSSGAWLYLSVPVYAAADGALAVAGPPAFAAAPARAASPGLPGVQQPDEDLGLSLAGEVMTGYFTAWAASDTTALARYTTTDATARALAGLGSSVTLARVVEVDVPADGGDSRTATVALTWTGDVGTYAQTYRVDVRREDDGRWYVHDVKPGAVTEGGGQVVDSGDGSTVGADVTATGGPA